MIKYRESEEMYLETILLLTNKGNTIRSIDIATELNYSRASVSRAVNLLVDRGYVTVTNGAIALTESGKQRAQDIYERHEIITKVLVAMGADDAVAEDNACRIEHVITADLVQTMKQFLQNK